MYYVSALLLITEDNPITKDLCTEPRIMLPQFSIYGTEGVPAVCVDALVELIQQIDCPRITVEQRVFTVQTISETVTNSVLSLVCHYEDSTHKEFLHKLKYPDGSKFRYYVKNLFESLVQERLYGNETKVSRQ